MISFTDDAYRQYFYRHWDWMAKTGVKRKGSYIPLSLLKGNYTHLDQAIKKVCLYECFACGAANGIYGELDCCRCPIYSTYYGSYHCSYDYTEYRKWEKANTKKERKKYARQIAHLLWRGKSREQWEKEDRGE